MEEMVSTEALENEILEDARKKGERLLKEADAQALHIGLESTKKIALALESLTAEYREKAELYRAENQARLPLEKGRMKARFIDGLLRDAVASYLASLDMGRTSAAVEEILSRGASLVGDSEIELGYKGFSESEARAILARALPAARIASAREERSLPAPGLRVTAKGGKLRIRATLDLVGERLLDEKRGELAVALCPEALAI